MCLRGYVCAYQCQHLYQSVHLSAFKTFNNELAFTTEKRVRVRNVSGGRSPTPAAAPATVPATAD